MAQKQKTAEEIYKRNQKIAKALKILAPIVFWGGLALCFTCIVLAVRHSLGNIAEICDMLDNSKWTGDELRDNYNILLDKYGEWVIGNGGNGFTIRFINIGRAVFSSLMIANCTLSIIFLATACVLGKWILPKISAQLLASNQDMVNLTILKNQ